MYYKWHENAAFFIYLIGDYMNFKVGDIVTRISYNNDIIFKILDINKNKVTLKGLEVRLLADADILDLKKVEEEIKEEVIEERSDIEIDSDFFYLPGKVLHIDGDEEYLEKCLKYYKSKKIYAIGKKVKEKDIASQLEELLKYYNPDILIITGHDAFIKKKGNKFDNNNYKNTNNFINAIKVARNYEKSHEKLIIIAGACQSNYEALIKAGANFASSPKRVNIHALDPAIIASYLSLFEKNKEINLKELLSKTKYGSDGMGGIICTGTMYVGYPRWI